MKILIKEIVMIYKDILQIMQLINITKGILRLSKRCQMFLNKLKRMKNYQEGI